MNASHLENALAILHESNSSDNLELIAVMIQSVSFAILHLADVIAQQDTSN